MSEEVPTAPNTAAPAGIQPAKKDPTAPHARRWMVAAWWLGFGLPLGALLVSLTVLPAGRFP